MKKVSASIIQKCYDALPDDKIKVYSYQNPHIMDDIENNSFICSDKNKIDPVFIKSYDWMKSQMKLNIPNFSGDYPIWAWLKSANHRHYSKFLRKINDKELLITAMIPRKRILFSCYDLWHCVLNGGPVVFTEKEYDETISKIDIENTWRRCLAVTTKYEGEWTHRTTIPQLCIDRIYQNEIIGMQTIG